MCSAYQARWVKNLVALPSICTDAVAEDVVPQLIASSFPALLTELGELRCASCQKEGADQDLQACHRSAL